jgi:hypothetical protein
LATDHPTTQNKQSIKALNTLKQKTAARANELIQSVKHDKIFLRVNKKLSFPWWFKIIAYIISYVFMIVALFFIILKGVMMGSKRRLRSYLLLMLDNPKIKHLKKR